jgi:hypothetical protein
MDIIQKPAKRRRVRFSLRVLIVVMTLVCLYFASWRPTVTHGVADVSERLTKENHGVPVQARPKAPLLLALEVVHVRVGANGTQLVTESTYYPWFYGRVAEMPFTKEWVRDLAAN